MTQILRQSTQVVVRIGPAVAVGDGFTPVTTLTLSGADEAELLKAAGAATVSIAGSTFAAISGADGWYDLTLSTTDTNTVGTADVVVNDDSLILPIFARFQVIEEAAYDAMYAASADPKADINVASIDANAITATSIAADAITAAKIADGAIDAATFAAGAITATVIATGAIDADAVAADAVAEIADGVWDEDATGHQTQGSFGQAIGDPVADTNTIYKAVVTDATGATVGVDVVAVKSDTAAILADTGTDGVVVAAASKTGYTLSAAGLADFFDTDSGTTYASAVAGSVVKEIADNAGGGTPPTAGQIADAVWDEAQADHVGAGTFGEVATETAAILDDTGSAGVVVAAGSKTGYALTAGERDSIAAALLDLANGVETGLTPRQALRLALSALAGKLSGAGSGTEVFRNAIADNKNRITATVDGDGNRTAIATDLT